MRNTAFVSPEHGEAELVAGAKRGDETAIRTIVRLQNQTLFRLARSIVSDQDAEDAVQEAYLRAFRDIGGFRGESSLKTWLGRIVVNAALERLRRERPDHVIPFPPPTPSGRWPTTSSGTCWSRRSTSCRRRFAGSSSLVCSRR